MFLRVSLRDTILLLKTSSGWILLFILRLNTASSACLLTSTLKQIFHWKALLLIILTSSFSSLVDTFASWTTENKDVTSANTLTLDDNLLDKSLI